MNTFPCKIIKLSTLFIAVLLIISCNKDADLLVDYVLTDGVLGQNSGQLAVNDYFETKPNSPIILDVLANDNFSPQDSVRIVETSTPTIGTVKINEETNTITYTPPTTSPVETPPAEVPPTPEPPVSEPPVTEPITDTFTYTTEVVNEDQTVSTETGTVEIAIVTEPAASTNAQLLFSSGFEGVSLSSVSGDYQYIRGIDNETGFAWPPTIWGSNTLEPNGIHLIEDGGSANLEVSLETVIGHDGSPTTALFQSMKQGSGIIQNNYQINDILDTPNAFYVKFWMKIDNTSLMANNSWRCIWQYKTNGWFDEGPGPGFRMNAFINRNYQGKMYWSFQGDDDPGNSIWEYVVFEDELPVVREQWFKVEVYAKMSYQNDGRCWLKINGHLIGEHNGPNMGSATDGMHYMAIWQQYGNTFPSHNYVDDIEIWDESPYGN
jgi:hypothetical protein